MKRCCYLLLATLLLMLASTASAATSGKFKYEIKGNGTATITGYSGASDENIIIPQMVDGYTVAAIGDKAFYKDEKNREIGISVTLPESVKSIGDFAFWNANVTSINLPDGLESIGKGVFVSCDEIVYRVSANHPMFAVIDGALYNKAKKELIQGKEGARIPEGIRIIGDYACYRISDCGIAEGKMALPSTIEEIGDYAFFESWNSTWSSDDAQQSQSWGENIRKIGDHAFEHASVGNSHNRIDEVIFQIPDSVEEIGEACFKNFIVEAGKRGVISIGAESKLRNIPDKAFYNDDWATWGAMYIRCEAPVSSIGEYAFSGHANRTIEKLNLEHVESIGKYAFDAACIQFFVKIPGSCKVISEGAFRDAVSTLVIDRVSVNRIELSDGIEKIESHAFENSAIEQPVYLPESLEDIATDAFDPDCQFTVEKGSYAHRWANENAYNCTVNGEEQNLDWLNN